jgi:hypothetical protein
VLSPLSLSLSRSVSRRHRHVAGHHRHGRPGTPLPSPPPTAPSHVLRLAASIGGGVHARCTDGGAGCSLTLARAQTLDVPKKSRLHALRVAANPPPDYHYGPTVSLAHAETLPSLCRWRLRRPSGPPSSVLPPPPPLLPPHWPRLYWLSAPYTRRKTTRSSTQTRWGTPLRRLWTRTLTRAVPG